MTDLRTILQEIHDRRTELTPDTVVDEARPTDHPLHHRFEWDDTVAGHRYRLVQAAELIRSVKVVYAVDDDGHDKHVRAFLPVRRDPHDAASSYEPVEDVMNDEFRRRLVLAEFDRDWKALRARYSHLAEFARIVARDLAEPKAS